jgi:Flp pilus assembly protein TadG
MRPRALRLRITIARRCVAGRAPVRIVPRRARPRLLRDERGAVSAELVIATPLLLLLIMAVIQFALWEHAEHIATAVAQQGVSVGRLQDQTAGAGQQEAQSVLDQLGPSVLTGSKITATRTAEMTTVTVTGHAESIVGLFSLPVRATASGASENYTNPGQGP